MAPSENQLTLFELPELSGSVPTFKPFRYPVWTESKARLIERYLYYFVLITKHGVYIDGFAGPQEPDKLDTWAAHLVLNSELRWLRNFFLCDANQSQYQRLVELKASHFQNLGSLDRSKSYMQISMKPFIKSSCRKRLVSARLHFVFSINGPLSAIGEPWKFWQHTRLKATR